MWCVLSLLSRQSRTPSTMLYMKDNTLWPSEIRLAARVKGRDPSPTIQTSKFNHKYPHRLMHFFFSKLKVGNIYA